MLAASQSPLQKKWFQGTADAVRQYLWLFENSMREGVEDFLILAGALALWKNPKSPAAAWIVSPTCSGATRLLGFYTV